MLSGGLDSRVVALASPRRLACVTLHQHEGREVRTARRVAHRLGHSHYFERLPDAFPLELATEGTLVADGRDGFQHAYPLYLERWLHDEGVDALLGGWFLETYFSDTDLLRSGVKVRGQERPLPLLASMEELDIPEWVWQWRLKGNQREMGELVPAERLERVAADAKQRIRARMDDLCRRASNGQALATVVRTGELSTHQTHANATAAERLAPAPILLCDTDLIELFFDIPREHRLLHRLYSHVLTAVDRRVRWVPYSNTGVPVSSWMWAEYLAGSLRQEASRAAEACWRRVSPGYAPTRFAWPPFGPTVRARPEWQAYLRRRASASRLADLGVLSGDGVRRLVEEHLGGQRRDWELLKLWVTVEEWLERYG